MGGALSAETKRTIAEWAQRAGEGDRAAFGELYARYHNEVLAYARRNLPTPEDAEDLVAQAFHKALRSIGRRDQSRPFNVWLFHLTRNLIADFHRTRKQLDPLEAGDRPVRSCEDEVLRELIDGRIEAALAHLTARQRWVIQMRFFEGLEYPEVAERLGCRETAVRATQMRALRALRSTLQAGEGPASASA